MPSPPATTASMRGSVELLRSHPRLRGAVLCIFLYVGAEVAIGSILVNYLAQPTVMALPAVVAGQLLAFYWGGAMLGRFAGAWILRRFRAGVVLAAFALAAVLLVTASALTDGPFAGWLLLAVGCANSIMFPTIFSLGVEGLDADAPRASGLLCTAIVGGAVVPLAVGMLADATTLNAALAVPLVCYALIASYGWQSRRSPQAVGD